MPKEETERINPSSPTSTNTNIPFSSPCVQASDSDTSCSVVDITRDDSQISENKNLSVNPDTSVSSDGVDLSTETNDQSVCVLDKTTDDSHVSDVKNLSGLGGSCTSDIADPGSETSDPHHNQNVCEESNGCQPYKDGFISVDTVPDEIADAPDTQHEESLEIPDGMTIEDEVQVIEDGSTAQASVEIVPSYSVDFEGVLADREFSMETGKPVLNDARPRKTCFNCLGDHNVSECPQPPDQSRIAANRKKHLSSRTTNVRYHEDCENKYGQYQPGRLSEGLRHALGLRRNELPLYVYRMRVLGYPPGWLQDAEVHQADVKMYDGLGKRVSHPDEEEGEINITNTKYHPEKLVSFPGFNDPLPRGIVDDCHRYNFPPMQQHHQRSEFLRFMNMNKAEVYRKRKLKGLPEHSARASATATRPLPTMDMDVDAEQMKSNDIEFNPPLPDEPLPPPPPEESPPSPPRSKRSSSPEEGEISDDSQDALNKFDLKRRNPSSQPKDSTENTVLNDEDCQDSSQDGSQSEGQEEAVSEENGVAVKKSKQHHRSHSKSYTFGTYIPESCTPFKALPDSEKWTVDVSEHIVFDNLPDALGTWDKMRGVMGNVKQRMSELHTEEDD